MRHVYTSLTPIQTQGRRCLGDDRGVYKLNMTALGRPRIVSLPCATRLICSDRPSRQPACHDKRKKQRLAPFGFCCVHFPSTPLERRSAVDGKSAHPPTELV
jgi:hypothetical protein